MTSVTSEPIGSLDAFLEAVSPLSSGWCFRGHKDASWGLETTLERVFPKGRWDPEVASTCERASLEWFRSRMPHYVSKDVLPDSRLAWLATMQHHGVPTRLLDVTFSPLVALFFALPAPSQPVDFSVWAINYRQLNKSSCAALGVEYAACQVNRNAFFEKVFEPHQGPLAIIIDPDTFNFRLERQKGAFLVANSASHRLSEVVACDTSVVRKFVIPRSCIRDARSILTMAAIDASRLFGDLDGLSRDIATDLARRVHESLEGTTPVATNKPPSGN